MQINRKKMVRTVIFLREIMGVPGFHCAPAPPIGIIIQAAVPFKDQQTVTNSYLGHFKHADSYKLINEQINKNDILVNVLKFENERFIIKDNCKDRFYNLYTQYQYFKKRYPNHLIFFKTGCYYEFYGKQAIIVNILFGCKFLKPRKSFELNGLYHRAGIYENCFYKYFKICLDNNIEIIRVNQKGLLAGNIKKREIDLKFNLNLGLI